MNSWSVFIEKWKELRKGMLVKTLIVLLCILFGYFYNIVGVLGVLNGYIIGKIVIDSKENKLKRWLVQALSTNVFILFLYLLNQLLGTFSAVLAFLVITLVLAMYLLWKQRKQYMEAVRTIETMIWGKPLDRKKNEGRK